MDLSAGIIAVSYQRLITKEQLTRDAFMQILIDRNLYPSSILIKIDAAFERGVEHDYFSAVHILIPLIESCFMHLSKLISLDTITLDGKEVSTRNKTLDSRLLSSAEYQQKWGKDFCMMLDFYLYSGAGYGYRNKVAHGEIQIEQTHFGLNATLLHIIMSMSFRVRVDSQS